MLVLASVLEHSAPKNGGALFFIGNLSEIRYYRIRSGDRDNTITKQNMIASAVGLSEIEDSRKAGEEAAGKAIRSLKNQANLIIVFASSRHNQEEVIAGINAVSGDAEVVGCSDAGQITGNEKSVSKGGVVAMALHLGDVKLVTAEAKGAREDSHAAGKSLAESIIEKNGEKPSLLVIFIEGLAENGAAVVRGIQEVLGENFPIMGGSAGDDFRFEKTHQYYQGKVLTGSVVGIALTGEFSFGMGVKHGWEPIGLPMTVTKAKGAVLQEVDGKPALSIYQDYFGKRSEELIKEPLAKMAYTYPLGMAVDGNEELLIRDVVIANEAGEITAAAEIPEGSQVRLMIGDREKAIAAAAIAAENAMQGIKGNVKAAIMFNCIARNKLLGVECGTEINAVREVIGKDVPMIGFYTYGEVGPFQKGEKSVFHNETMNLLLLGE